MCENSVTARMSDCSLKKIVLLRDSSRGSLPARTAKVEPNRRTLVDTLDVSGISRRRNRYTAYDLGR